jgi:hypothetical protein
MATSWPIKFYTAAKPGGKRKSDNDAQNKNNEKDEANRNLPHPITLDSPLNMYMRFLMVILY